MLVVEFTDGSTLDCTDYEEADNGLEFTYDDDFKAYVPYGNLRCVYRKGAPGGSPDVGSTGADGDTDHNYNANTNHNS